MTQRVVVTKFDFANDDKYREERVKAAFDLANQTNLPTELVWQDYATGNFVHIRYVQPNILRTRNDETSLPIEQLKDYMESRSGANSSIYPFERRFMEVLVMNFTSLRRDNETLLHRVNELEKQLQALQQLVESNYKEHCNHLLTHDEHG